jgi:hypothetical protein
MRMSHRTSVIATERRGGRVPVSSSGRSCSTYGCLTILSIYNSSQWCFTHNPPTFLPGMALRG